MEGTKKQQTGGEALHDLFREVFALRDALAGIMDGVHERTGLSTPKRKVLQSLKQGGPQTMPDMAYQLGVSRQFMRAECNELLAEGLLEFEDNPRHKRSKLAVMTDAGQTALGRAQSLENEIIAGLVPDVDLDRVGAARELLALLRKAVQGLPVKR
jgi:DNA-binding MarR family transcriptional regulator